MRKQRKHKESQTTNSMKVFLLVYMRTQNVLKILFALPFIQINICLRPPKYLEVAQAT